MSTDVLEHLLLQIVAGTFANGVSAFLVDRRSQGLSKNTLELYGLELQYFQEYLDSIGAVKMDEVTADVIRKYLLELATHRNPGGCHVSYRVLRTFTLWWERETDGEYTSPIRKVKPPRVNQQPLPGITIDDIQRMIDSCQGSLAERDKAIFYCLLDTGARASEFLAINLQDVNLFTGVVQIKHGKGDKHRVTFLGAKSRRSLKAYLKTRVDNNTALWITETGTRLTKAGLRQILRRRANDAIIATPGAHDFRRAFCLNMLRNGTDIITLSRLMGHSGLDVLKRYLAQSEDDLLTAHRRCSPVDNAF